MRKALFAISFLLFIGQLSLFGQSINVMEDAPIGDMMQKYVSDNKAQTVLAGYRIQLLATTDRQKVESSMRKFKFTLSSYKC